MPTFETSFITEVTLKVKVSYIPDKGYPETREEPGEPPNAEITSVEIVHGKGLIPIHPDFIEHEDLEAEALEDAYEQAQDQAIAHAEMKMDEAKYHG